MLFSLPGGHQDRDRDQRDLAASRLIMCVVVIALANFAGWFSNTTLLISVSAGLPSMVPSTAALALIASAGLLVLQRRAQWSWQCALLPGALLLLAIAIEACYARGQAPAPLLLAKSGNETGFTLPSTMTARLFCTLACAQLLLVTRRLVIAAQCLAMAAFFVALLNLGGYVLRDTFLFQMLPTKGTSILTTATIMLLAAASLLIRPHAGLMAAVSGTLPGAQVSRRLLLSAFLVPILTGGAVAVAMALWRFDAETMLVVFVWLVILFFLLIVWRLALRLAASDQERAAAQQALEQAVRNLRAEHQSKDMFMATLAHELRNPLAPISAAAQLLKHGGGKTAADRMRLGDIIAGQTTNLVNLVNDIMDVERLSTGRLTLDKQAVDVRRAIARAVEQVAPMLEQRQQQYVVDTPITPLCVTGDYLRLTQVFANLLTNAAKYTEPGGKIAVWAAVRDHEAHITVADNGSGMDEKLLARLFEPYVQARITPNRADGGLGLGLALVKKLTELHGGTVVASSEGLGCGSSFTVTLPLLSSEHALPAHDAPAAAGAP